jgi:hypothetical protein
VGYRSSDRCTDCCTFHSITNWVSNGECLSHYGNAQPDYFSDHVIKPHPFRITVVRTCNETVLQPDSFDVAILRRQRLSIRS